MAFSDRLGGKKFSSINDALTYLLDDYPIYPEKPILLTIPDPPAYYVDLHKTDFENLNSAKPL